jgi:uncharacterized protein (TIGR03437 family)
MALSLFVACCGVVHAQNTVSLNPSTVFLNTILNGGPAQTTVAVSSSPGAVGIAVAPPTAPWITVTQGAATTPTTLTVTANPSGLAAAVYSTLVTVTTPSGTALLEVVMTVNNQSSLVPSPNGLVFTFVQGATPPMAQTVTISSSSPSGFSLTGTANWLTFSTNGLTAPGAPGTVTINVNPTSVSGPGVYVGGVTINPASGLPPITIPVVFYYQASPPVTVTPSALTFNFQNFGTNNILQKALNVSSGTQPVSFSASSTVTTVGPSWLAVMPTQGTTPAMLTVAAVQPAAEPPGTYQGTVTITAPGASNPTTAIPITLNVSNSPLLDLNIQNLTFTYQVGGTLPPDQFITPTSTTPNLGYTLAISTNNTGSWLSAANSGGTPNPVDVSVNPVGLAPGTYMGTLSFTAPNGGNNPQVANVTLNVVNNPTLLTTPTTATGLTFNYETGQSTPGTQMVSVTSSGAPLGFALSVAQNSTSNNASWLQVGSPTATTTPASFLVGVNTTGMAPGQYTGTVLVSTPNGAIQVTLAITLNISAAGTSLMSTNPQALAFSVLTGGTAPTQQVSVNTTGEPIIYTATPNVSTPAGGSWLVVGPPSGAASSTNISNFQVGLNVSALTPGNYKGSVVVAPSNGTPNVNIPVSLSVTNGNLISTPPSLSFTQASFGAAPPPQNISLTSSGPALQFNVTTSGGNWFSVSPAIANTPATLAVAVNAANLQPGSYTGQINIVSAGAGNSPLAIPLNLTVTSGQSFSLTTGAGGSALTFTVPAGSAAPPAQTVMLAASTGTLAFLANINITTPQGGNWLSVSPTGGSVTTTPTPLTISVNPAGLNPGTYTGSVSVTSPNASNSPQMIPVTLVVTPVGTPVAALVLNGASMQTGAVSAGEIVAIQGTSLGPPAPGVNATAGANNMQPTLVSDTQVMFDNVAAPLLYVSAGLINAVVPYEVAGQTQTKMIVTYKGAASSPLTLNVAPSAPGIFLSGGDGVPPTQGDIFNADGSSNSPDNPAAKESQITLLATGEGQTTPAGATGLVIAADGSNAKTPLLPVSVTIGGQAAQMVTASSLPGFVSGFLQITAVVPDAAPSGGTVPIVVTIGINSSSGGTTVAIQ